VTPGGLIGLVLTGRAAQLGVEPFFMELIAGIEEALTGHGADVLLHVVPDGDAELATYRRWAARQTVDAVVVVNLEHDDVRPGELARLGLVTVLAGRHRDVNSFHRVVTDDYGAMTAAMEMLVELGHSVIGRVSGPADLVHTAERSAAMGDAAERHGVRIRSVESDYSPEGGVRGLRELLSGHPSPTAVIFDNDVMAVAAEQELCRSGVAVPDDVSLLAGDDSPLCELAVPPLSALGIDVHEHGLVVGRAVLEAQRGEPPREHPGPPIAIRRRDSTGHIVTS
jgi:DNA-binding LacI/PurR family transcriptional regulator